MLPDSEHLPSVFPQLCGHRAVPLLVAFNLSMPITSVRAGNPLARSAPVPEATIDEYNNPLRLENKIGLAAYIRRVHGPATDTSPD